MLQTPQWQSQVGAIAGYAPVKSGEVLSMRQVLPWWRFPNAKQL
jgi:hypothetical protein